MIGHYLEDLGGKNCFISVSHLLTWLLYAILKLLKEGKGAPEQTHLPYRVTTIQPHLPPLQPLFSIKDTMLVELTCQINAIYLPLTLI